MVQTEKAERNLEREMKIQKSISHKHICKLERIFEDKLNHYFLLELCFHGNLQEMLNKRGALDEIEVVYFALQILKILVFLQHKLIIHRDLKLANFLIGQGLELKLGDFGLAVQLENNFVRRYTFCGPV